MLECMELDRALLANHTAQMKTLQTAMSALAYVISSLHTAQNAVFERLQSYKYPVLSLPNEIVAEIFIQFLPPYPEQAPLVGPSSPTHLTQICRQWREIALSTPALWSAIMPSNTQPDLAALWCARSGSCPLSIQAVDAGPGLNALVPHRDRWEHLVLGITHSPPAVIDGPMPLLHSLMLSANRAIYWSSSPIKVRDVPLLRMLSLYNFYCPNITVRWAQLTTLNLNGISPEEWAPVLRQALRLVHLFIDLWDDSRVGPMTDIKLPRLESLTFAEKSHRGKDFLQYFVVSALRQLYIPEHVLGSHPVKSLKAFVKKSKCSVKDLRIIHASVPEASYRAAFPSIPQIIIYKV
ncbi:F-box domain-containing protein [Favolaschia claudopus]|uniref:F-box domain-containing protein n=1 Tax=Favolaschia claudopus TaxID=2862362 RepID=A0AAW0DG85_9AGAR